MNKYQIKNISKLFKNDALEKFNKYTFMFKTNISEKNIEDILPDYMLESYKKLLLEFNLAIDKKDTKNYKEKFLNFLTLNTILEDFYIDFKVYNFLVAKEKNETLRTNLKSFRNKINYNFSNTSTGRLTCKDNSANILTLPKKYRNIFESKWKSEGSLLMIDFSSLEPRIAKKLTSKENYKDIYEEIKSLTEENLDRSVIKRAVISTLYGSSTSLDNISKEKTDQLIKTCKDFFDYEKIFEMADTVYPEGCRKSYFGRPLWNKNETRKHVIVNNFIQSSAVDVSLSFFLELIGKAKTEFCRPIFIIHDAIVFDVHNDHKKDLVNLVEKGYNCPELGYFPLEITNFMETKY
jgi:hypothetical protein